MTEQSNALELADALNAWAQAQLARHGIPWHTDKSEEKA